MGDENFPSHPNIPEEFLDTILTWGPKTNIRKPNKSLTDLSLVLDIDECMVHTFKDMTKFKQLGIFRNPDLLYLRKRTYRLVIDDLENPGSLNTDDIWGVTRPHLHTFLSYGNKYFKHIFVWSSGHKRYVNSVVNRIFRDLPKPDGVLSNEDCGIYEGDKFYKPLTHLYKEYSHLNLSPKTTLMIDDFPPNMRSNKGNGIVIPGYKPNPRLDSLTKNDTAFLDILDWLKSDEVLNCSDIRKVDKPEFSS